MHGLGYSHETTAFAYGGVWTYIPVMSVNLCNENFKSLLITLGYERVFDYTNII